MKKLPFIIAILISFNSYSQNIYKRAGDYGADTCLETGFTRKTGIPSAPNKTAKFVQLVDVRGVEMKITVDSFPAGGGSGVNTLAAIGSSPNANGATISGSTLNLEPADGSFGGVVTTGTQTIAGAKTFSSAFTSSTSTTSPILIGGTGTGSSISIRPTSGVGSTGADIIFQNGNNGGTEIARVTGSNGYTGFGTASPVMKFDITNGTQVTGANSGNPNALNVTGSNQALTGGGATMFLNSNSAMGADVGASLAFTALRVSGDNTSDMIFAIAKGAKENASSGNYNGYFAIATQSHNLGALAERFRITSSGNVGIGTSSPAASAVLDVTSTTGGALMPRMTTTQRDAISSPATGLELFNTTTNTKQIYDGTRWVEAAHPLYKVYTALLTQSGTDAPTATVLENNLGGTVVWTRDDIGQYTATLSGAFTSGKTFFATVPQSVEGPMNFAFLLLRNDANSITLSGNVGLDDELDNSVSSIEIRVYY